MISMNHTHPTHIEIYVMTMTNELSPFILRQGAKGIMNNIIQQAKGDIILFTRGGNTLFLAQGCIPFLDKRNSSQGQ